MNPHPFESPIDPGERTRVLVIGGGAAGLAALSQLHRDHTCSVQLLERSPRLGGVWDSARYPGLRTHIQSYSYRFHDFQSPTTATAYATRQEVLDYFQEYVTHRGLEERLQMSSTVESVTLHQEADHLRIVAALDGRSAELHASFVVCAVGYSNAGAPSMPVLDGADAFAGQILHSSELDSTLFEHIVRERKRVILLGAGKSAHDIALQFVEADAADRFDWVYRNALWGLNRERIYGRDRSTLGALISAGQHTRLRRRSPDDPQLEVIARALRESGVYLNIDGGVDVQHFRGAHYSPTDIERLVRTTTRHRTTVDSLTRSGVRLGNGAVLNADYVICATGYRRAANLPVINSITSGGDEAVAVDPRTAPLLYRGMIDPRMPRVVHFTGESTFPSQVYGYSLAAAWLPLYVAQVRAGQLAPAELREAVSVDDRALNDGVPPELVYRWIPPPDRNLSGGTDYAAIEAADLYRRQVHTDLGISARLQSQLGLAVFDADSFARTNQQIVEALDLPVAEQQ